MTEPSSYWQRFWQRRLSRRALMKGMLLAGGAAAASLGVACEEEKAPATPSPAAVRTPVPPKPGGTVRAPLVGLSSANPPTLDNYKELTYLAKIPAAWHYSRLLKYKAGPDIDLFDYSQVEGDLAERWEIPEPTVLIFHLRPNIRFHNKPPLNGRPLTRDDILFSAQRMSQESPDRGNWLAFVDRVEAPDDRTVRIILKGPYAPALTMLANPELFWIQPKEIKEANLQENPIGTGPFIFEGFEKDVAIRWRKNPDYYIPNRPFVDRWEASVVGDPSTIIANLKTKTFPFALLAAAVFPTAQAELPGFTFTFSKNAVPTLIYFNFDLQPWGDERVRQAFSLAMDREGMLKALDPTGKGGYHSAISQLPPWWLDPKSPDFGPNARYFQRNVAEAKRLLEAAGYPNGLDVKMYYSPVYGAAFNQMVELVAATVKDAGFRVTLVPQEYAAYLSTTFRGNIRDGIATGPLMGSPVDPEHIFSTVYHPNSPRHNWGGTGPGSIAQDKTLLDMFDKQRTELDLQRRIALVHDIQRYLAQKMYLVPHVAPAGVSGYWADMVGWGEKDVWFSKGGYAWTAEVGIHLWLKGA
ncbi:MAG: ABC transporter substrate-binding protein [Dehalococcoidia bacterium]|nr:ABC transporter substrate-binding protein [Dehalococcoidia bacterium]